MTKRKKITKKRVPRLVIDENIRKLFPPVSQMGSTTPVPYESMIKPSKLRVNRDEQIYSTSLG